MFRSPTKPPTARRRPLGLLLALALPTAIAGLLLGPAGPAHAAGRTLYVADADTDSVVAIDAASGTITATIPVAVGPQYTAVTPDGSQVFVSTVHAISVISASSDTVTATIPLDSYVPGGDTARQVTVDPAGAFAYVVTTDGYLLKIATATDTVTGTVRVAVSKPSNMTRAVAISPDGATLYVSGDSSSVSVVDTATLTVRSVINTGDLRSEAIAVAPDGSHVYVAYDHHFIPMNSVVDVISTATGQLTASIPVATYTDGLQGIAVTPDGASVYVTASVSNTVSVISTATNTVTRTLSGLTGPVAIAIDRTGTTAFVSTSGNGNGSIAVIDTASNTITSTISGIGFPFGLSVGPTPRNTPAVTTQLSAPSVNVGGAISDAVTLTGSTASSGGSIMVYAYSGSGTSVCTTANQAAAVGPLAVSGDGTYTADFTSASLPAGPYEFAAVYSGDPGNAGASSNCGDEPLTVAPAGTTTASLTDSGGNPIAGAAVTFRPASGPATNATTGSDGTASVVLTPGTYAVTMNYATGYQTKTLTVTASGPNAVSFATLAVTAQISDPSSTDLAAASVAHAGNTGSFGPKTPVDPGTGQVTFQVLPGTNTFTAWDAGGYQTQTLTVTGPVTVTFATVPVTVTVLKDGSPLTTAQVAHAGNSGSFGPKTAVDGNGQVTVQVLPGTNTFTAWDGSAYTNETLTVTAATSTSISVT